MLKILQNQILSMRARWQSVGVAEPRRSSIKMNRDEFELCLDRLDLRSGDFLVVHHSNDNLGLSFNALQVIESLRARIGKGGHLMMLSTPFWGRSVAYLANAPTYDLRQPSRIGIISEMFRRLPDVYRTWHPVSAVCISGPDAKMIAAAQKDLEWAYGEDSAYGFAARYGARIIGLGVGVKSLSPTHYIETLHRKEWPIYTLETYPIRATDGTRTIDYVTRALNPNSLRRWRSLQQALESSREFNLFTASQRIFYACPFAILKSVSEQLLYRKQYFLSL